MPEFECDSHQLPGGKITLSPHGKWLASVGADGKLMVRTVGLPVSTEYPLLEICLYIQIHSTARNVIENSITVLFPLG